MHIIEYEEFEKNSVFFMNNPNRIHFSFVLAICFFLTASFIWICLFSMDDSVKVSAFIRPEDNISTVYAMPGGEVIKKNFRNGDNISKGDVLIQLDTKADVVDLENTQKRKKQIEKEIISYNTYLSLITGERELKKSEIDSRAQNYIFDNQRFLSNIEITKLHYEREIQKPEALQVKQNIDDLKRQYDETVLQYDSWKKTQELQAKENMRGLIHEDNTLERRINDLSRNIKNSTIIAPISGAINEFRKMNIGDTIISGEKILDIIPSESDAFIAEIYVDPSYIVKIEENQKVRFSIPGLPTAKFGYLTGRIQTIPPDCIISNGKPIFVVTAKLDKNFLECRNGKKVFLRPGITSHGRIIVDKQKIILMLLEKIGFWAEK